MRKTKPKKIIYCPFCAQPGKHPHVFCKKCKRIQEHCECNVDWIQVMGGCYKHNSVGGCMVCDMERSKKEDRIRKRDGALPLDRSLLTYQQAVALVALNESPGDAEALQLDHVAGLVGVVLVADIFGVDPDVFARQIIRYRKKHK